MNYIRYFNQISMDDVAKVGGKTASLGEMFNQLTTRGLRVPNGFAITSDAYWQFLDHNKLKEKISAILKPITQQTSLDELKKTWYRNSSTYFARKHSSGSFQRDR